MYDVSQIQYKYIHNLDTYVNLVFDGNSMKINLAGSLTTQTFSEALSGQNLARIINESGAMINSNAVQAVPNGVTQNFDILVVTGTDETDGTILTEIRTLKFKNGVLVS